MFEQKKAVFYYAVSPVHMGAGQALGMVDNPIQREVHTGHPVFAGSGLKGAFRHEAKLAKKWNKPKLNEVFGPEDQSGDLHAGAISLTDAQIVLFPVRSMKKGFVYVTSPLVLQRAARLLAIAGNDDLETAVQGIPDMEDGIAMFDDSLKSGDKLILEAFWFSQYKKDDAWTNFGTVLTKIAELGLSSKSGFSGFAAKIQKDSVLVSDEVFNYFVKNSMVVEPHVRIDDATGTAADGALFYTESLPPETLMIGLMMSSKARAKDATDDASAIEKNVTNDFNEHVLQIGGDSTTGRGLVMVKFV